MVSRNERKELAETIKTTSDGAARMGNFCCSVGSPGYADSRVLEEASGKIGCLWLVISLW